VPDWPNLIFSALYGVFRLGHLFQPVTHELRGEEAWPAGGAMFEESLKVRKALSSRNRQDLLLRLKRDERSAACLTRDLRII
jgi:hypothetical protein